MAIIKYKLTNQNLQTYKGFQWQVGMWQEAKGDPNQDLCTDAWLYCYDSPLLAVLHNPLHGNIQNPRLWEIECEGETKNDNGMSRGYWRMRLMRELPMPQITTEQCVRYAILCTKQVYTGMRWNIWADSWLLGSDRTGKSARAAEAWTAWMTEAWAWATAVATEATAMRAAAQMWAAAEAARAAAEAAVEATMETTEAAEAAEAATWAVRAKPLNLIELAEQAIGKE